jgi:hypothetical protein
VAGTRSSSRLAVGEQGVKPSGSMARKLHGLMAVIPTDVVFTQLTQNSHLVHPVFFSN